MSQPTKPSDLDNFMFDLQGFIILKNAVEGTLLEALNQAIDLLPPLEFGQWLGHAQRRDYTKNTGLEVHQCLELGPAFEELIDHQSWISHLRRYCGEERSYVEGLFIDEWV